MHYFEKKKDLTKDSNKTKILHSFFDNKSDNGNPTYPKPITEMHNFLELIFFKIFFL